jgi:hypothetical protein
MRIQFFATLTAIAMVVMALPAIAQPISDPPTTQQTVTKAIAIADIVGVYQLTFQPNFIKIKPDGSYEMIGRKNALDPKTEYLINGRVRIENNIVFLDAQLAEGPYKAIEDKGGRVRLNLRTAFPDQGYSFRQYTVDRGVRKSLLSISDPIVKFREVD